MSNPGTFDWEGIDECLDTGSVSINPRTPAGLVHPEFTAMDTMVSKSIMYPGKTFEFGGVTVGPPRVYYSKPEQITYLLERLAPVPLLGPPFTKEFKEMAKKKVGARYLAAQHEKNKMRNRYADILPYDDTRVRVLDDENDYINANHLQSTVGGIQYWYIACQGPLKNTVNHFWKMVWQQGSKLIVMVASETENGVVKCERYWPEDEGKQEHYGDISVTTTKIRANDNYTIRGLKLVHAITQESRVVWHLQYDSWPDHGVPAVPAYFLSFVDEIQVVRAKSRCMQAEAPWPVVVHCSAGIGRTGVLMVMEILLAKSEARMLPDVETTLKELREQRCSLIQTMEQYNFVYQVRACKRLCSFTSVYCVFCVRCFLCVCGVV